MSVVTMGTPVRDSQTVVMVCHHDDKVNKMSSAEYVAFFKTLVCYHVGKIARAGTPELQGQGSQPLARISSLNYVYPAPDETRLQDARLEIHDKVTKSVWRGKIDPDFPSLCKSIGQGTYGRVVKFELVPGATPSTRYQSAMLAATKIPQAFAVKLILEYGDEEAAVIDAVNSMDLRLAAAGKRSQCTHIPAHTLMRETNGAGDEHAIIALKLATNGADKLEGFDDIDALQVMLAIVLELKYLHSRLARLAHDVAAADGPARPRRLAPGDGRGRAALDARAVGRHAPGARGGGLDRARVLRAARRGGGGAAPRPGLRRARQW
jgi:hypothetical protein